MTSRDGVSVLAFDPENEIGVDVERLDEAFEFESIVKHFFSAKEIQYIFQPEADSRQRFYHIWTRKEAYLKAIGTGITESLRTEVLDEIMNDIRLIGNGRRPGTFTFRSILFEQDFLITLAIKTVSEPIQAYYLRNFRTGLLEKNEA
jgi:4'-phosphopantetheinyl transferase